MRIDFANLQYQYQLYKEEIDSAIERVLNKSNYILGQEVEELEENLSKFTNSKYTISCSSGTDALLLALMAIDIEPDDEIITTPFTFIATAETIALLKAKPVFVDIDENSYNIDYKKIEEKVTPKTKGVVSVSLYGQPSDLDEINEIAKKYNLFHIVDGAQSFGATYREKAEVHYCDIYTTSFFPAKPLGCFGDGGAVLTDNNELAKKIKMLRVHGQNRRYYHKYIGLGARMDTIQSAILDVKLKYYAKDLKLRQEVAQKYNKALGNKALASSIILPKVKEDRTSAFAQYSIRVKNRDILQKKLQERGIPTAIHYPMPLHFQECFRYLEYREGDFPISEKVSKEIISLPINPYLKDSEIRYISKSIEEVLLC